MTFPFAGLTTYQSILLTRLVVNLFGSNGQNIFVYVRPWLWFQKESLGGCGVNIIL